MANPQDQEMDTTGLADAAPTPWWATVQDKIENYQIMVDILNQAVDPNAIKELIAMVEFQGFDPMVITQKLIKSAPSKADLIEDVTAMIIIAITRGTVLTKIRKAMSNEGQNLLDKLIKRYGLESTGLSNSDRRNVVTLARVCACFPVKCVQVLNLSGYEHPDKVTDFPAVFSFPAVAALIPKHDLNLRGKFLEWSTKFAARTAKKGAAKPNIDIATNLLDMGSDKLRCRLWNLAVAVLLGTHSELKYSNGEAYIDAVAKTAKEAMDLVKFGTDEPKTKRFKK